MKSNPFVILSIMLGMNICAYAQHCPCVKTAVRYWTQKRGAKVFGIGIDKSQPKERSPFYGVEYRSVYLNWKYTNVVKLEGY